MQIIRRFNFVLIIHLFMVGCKKDIVASSKIDVNSNKAERINKNDKTFPKLEEIKHSPSLVISCGSGCAMTYNTKMITQNGLDIKVKFTVDLFINEELSDTYNETYIFSYNSLYKLKKITKESEGNEDFLETQSIDNQRSFRDFAKDLIENKTDVSENYFKDSYIKLPYNNLIDYKSVQCEHIECSKIEGLSKITCDTKNIRSIPFPNKNDLKVILIAQDCGDFLYRFYLVTIKKNTVVGNLYVEGEWYEPEGDVDKEITTFSINNKYNIQVNTTRNTSTVIKNYIIADDGKLVRK